MGFLIDFVNWLIQQVGNLGQGIIDLLPTSPLQWMNGIDHQLLKWINWLIPVGEMIVAAQVWLVCIGLWYVVRVALNWIKVTGG